MAADQYRNQRQRRPQQEDPRIWRRGHIVDAEKAEQHGDQHDAQQIPQEQAHRDADGAEQQRLKIDDTAKLLLGAADGFQQAVKPHVAHD